ncbi:hypothetical protein [Photobacterium sp. GB-72]|uniref:hypothetical protein n=1 Tax=Photobacterium sp. GB-72 TaxID=2022105 RepID=UPI000D15EEE4|nr:hypothetical protein [Photobacterium sp. GB-72]PSV30327.1 hypothetical protein C9J40_13670 [Photobacterium sp. GB-72]
MNKLEIAPHMLYRAAKSYIEAEDDFDYIQAILLAGAAMYICEPLLKEQGKTTQTMERAKRIIELREAGKEMVSNKLEIKWGANPLSREEKKQIIKDTRLVDRSVYNSLKHAGFFNEKKASEDLDMTNVLEEYQSFRTAAEDIILDAIQDYNNLDFNGEFKPYSLPSYVRKVLISGFIGDGFE